MHHKLSETVKVINFRGDILKEFKLSNLSSYDFAKKHIHEDRKHGVTEEEAQNFIVNTKIVVNRWKGKSLIYI